MSFRKNDDYLKAFGQNLKAIRIKQGVTQAYLADKIGVEFTEMSRIERGRQNITISTLYIIARALSVHPKHLLSFEFEK